MNTYHEDIEYLGKTIRIEADDDAQNPRIHHDNVGTMVCWHSRYNLGDKHDFKQPSDFKEWWEENGKGGVLLELYLYDHSGITMRCHPFSCSWDSGQVGYIYVTSATIEKEWCFPDVKPEWLDEKTFNTPIIARARKYLEGEVETYDQYLTGDVWGYIVDDDSCWGYFGKDSCIEEAKSVVEHQIERERKVKQEKLKTLVKNQVPLSVREKVLTNL